MSQLHSTRVRKVCLFPLSFCATYLTLSRKAGGFLCLIDFVSPVLALVFVEQIIIVFSGSFIKLTFVLERLLFTTLITAKLISLAFGKEYFPADFAFPEIKP